MEVKSPARVTKGCLLLIKHQPVQGNSGLDVPETPFFPFPALCIQFPRCDLLELSLCLCFQSLFMFPVARGDIFPFEGSTRSQLQPCSFTDPWKPEGTWRCFSGIKHPLIHQEQLTAAKTPGIWKASTFQAFQYFHPCLHCLFIQLCLELIFSLQ